MDDRKLKVVTPIKSQNPLSSFWNKSRAHYLKERLSSHEENLWNTESICENNFPNPSRKGKVKDSHLLRKGEWLGIVKTHWNLRSSWSPCWSGGFGNRVTHGVLSQVQITVAPLIHRPTQWSFLWYPKCTVETNMLKNWQEPHMVPWTVE